MAKQIDLNDLDVLPNAMEFGKMYRDRIGFDHTLKCWIAFDGVCWREDEGGVIFHKILKEYAKFLLPARTMLKSALGLTVTSPASTNNGAPGIGPGGSRGRYKLAVTTSPGRLSNVKFSMR